MAIRLPSPNRVRVILGCTLFLLPWLALGNPLAPPGDSGLRHDIRLLADAGIITGPIGTWPLAWPQVAADLAALEQDTQFSPAVAAALARVRWRVQINKHESSARAGAYARGGSSPQFLRSFDDTPRADAEAGVFLDWMAGHFAGRFEIGYALEPADDKELRADGSWIGAVLGNWMLAAGWLDRYWGPAWQGGLIVSNNARPRLGITLRRLRTDAWDTPWLSWLGPWQFVTFVERLEGDRAIPHVLVWGMRFAIRPFESLELGLSRTAQFGGEGRDVGLDTIINVLTGQTTDTNPAVGSADNINTIVGFDFRWQLPLLENTALYSEFGAEDESGSRPELVFFQSGLEFWGALGDDGASWRLIFEHADTTADLFGGQEERDNQFGITYNNSDFPTGYRYRGRSLGYPADGDALLTTVRAIFVSASAHTFRLVATTGEVNRGGIARNALTQRKEDVDALDLGYSHQYRWGELSLGLGTTRRQFDTGEIEDIHAWIGLSRMF